MDTAITHTPERRAPAANPRARHSPAETPQAPQATEATEGRPLMTAAVAAMCAAARRDRIGRAALALVWLGLLIGTAGIWQLQRELSRHPLGGAA